MYALTLWTFWQVLDIERLQRMEREFAALNEAHLVKIAFHDPNKLNTVGHQLQARYRLLPPREDVMRRAAALLRDASQPPHRKG